MIFHDEFTPPQPVTPLCDDCRARPGTVPLWFRSVCQECLDVMIDFEIRARIQ